MGKGVKIKIKIKQHYFIYIYYTSREYSTSILKTKYTDNAPHNIKNLKIIHNV